MKAKPLSSSVIPFKGAKLIKYDKFYRIGYLQASKIENNLSAINPQDKNINHLKLTIHHNELKMFSLSNNGNINNC